MERLVRLASVLHHAGDRGVPAPNLLEVAGWQESADGISALSRDFRHLGALGWQIENIAGQGTTAIYRMRTVDNRLRVKLTPAQQAALRRAVLLVDRADLADRLGLTGEDQPTEVSAALNTTGQEALATVVRGLRQRALLRFRYKGTLRTVHPASMHTYTTQWYLRGREDGEDVVKTWVVARMSEVSVDPPGTAERPELTRHPALHPMSWEIDAPVEVTLRTIADYVPDVRRWLGDPASVVDGPDLVELTYRVTNRAALRARIFQLGTRVTVVGPDDVRKELLHELATMAGE